MKRILTLIVVFLFVGCSAPSRVHHPLFDHDSFKVLVTSDIHHFDRSLFVEGDLMDEVLLRGDGKMLNRSEELLEAFILNVIEEKADVLLITGDLTLNGELMSHLSLIEGLRLIEGAGTRVYVVPGNHDVANPRSRGFGEVDAYRVDNVSYKKFSSLYGEFGFDGSESLRDPGSLSYLVKLSDSQWVFMLDSNNNTQKGKFASDISGSITDATLKWMEDQLVDSKANIIVGMHHNLFTHSDSVNKGFTIDNSQALLSQFEEWNISLVLSGHIHIQSIVDRGIVEIVSGAISVYPNQYGVIDFDRNGFDYRTERLRGVDEFLFDSEVYFLSVAKDKVMRRLSQSGLSVDDIERVSEMFAELNQYYFAGRVIDNTSLYRNSDAFILSKDYRLFGGYLDNILDNQIDKNSISK